MCIVCEVLILVTNINAACSCMFNDVIHMYILTITLLYNIYLFNDH